MDLKKAPRVNLDKRRFTNFIVGLLVTLSLILISFEWTSINDINTDLVMAREIDIDIEVMEAIPREKPKPPKVELPAVKEVINIVPDEIKLEDVDFIFEVTKDTEYDFVSDYTDETEIVDDAPIPFAAVEDSPLFNGGTANLEFTKYIVGNLIYPEIAAENGVSGRVTLQFVIDEKGNLIEAEILYGVDAALDAEALRVVRSSPKWTPGKQRNKPVKVSYTFPIYFRLQ